MRRLFWTILTLVSLWSGALAAQQDVPAHILELSEEMDLKTLLEIMGEEGAEYGETLEAEMFPGRGGDRWDAMVAGIYATDRLLPRMLEGLAAGIDADTAGQLSEFYRSDLGREIVALENAARRALLDPAAEEAAKEVYQGLDPESARITLIKRFAEVNDLLEQNVATALNSNYAFFSGLADGGAFGDNTPAPDDMLRDVWAQEEEVREETALWIFGFLAMAYAPLSDEEIESYVALSETEAGQTLNVALFASFGTVFRQVSRDLGLAAAQFMGGEDI